MAGHSQFKNIMHRKGAQDAKRGKIFTKIIREITVAVKEGGSDTNSNPRLRSALISARGANMPKDNVDRAIKRGEGNDDSANYSEVRYEGYGPSGTAFIVEALTDNRNRTASEVRAAFNKFNGSLGESNSVSFMFDRVGVVTYPQTSESADAFFEAGIECGADNVESNEHGHEIITTVEMFSVVRDHFIKTFGDPQSAQLAWRPKTSTKVPDDAAETLFKLIDVLEDNDDVQSVFSNYEVSDTIAQKLA
ncbi:MAG: YebC/PmpR family DNA-binding transcriptional regulator [Alphaproteobacteria bacterium]|nr:YebC/PmpR family DNA-binding transcriptional regulator [Alphaproteobacteria bacterium]OJV47561.1 MAG: transcriptional regulator [Alphaproteobacteria bacterium 43-37]